MKPPIRPVRWTPPPRLPVRPAQPLTIVGSIPLPALGEDVAVEADGKLVCGLVDGRVVRVDPHSHAVTELVQTGGRPGGLEVDRDGTLVVCDMKLGLLRVYPSERRCELLVDGPKSGILFCNNAALARDGSIYFSDSSRRFGIDHWTADILEHSGTGRLLRRTPDGRLEVLLRGLQFANGVALAPDESWVAVAESGAYRLQRLWLSGPRRGESEVLLDLPGFPDNLATDQHGQLWVPIASPRNPLLDFLHPRAPLLRKLVWALPERLVPQASRALRILRVDETGSVLQELAGSSPDFHMITGARSHGDALYLASLAESAILVCKL